MFIRIPDSSHTAILLNLGIVKYFSSDEHGAYAHMTDATKLYIGATLNQIHEVINEAYKQFDIK